MQRIHPLMIFIITLIMQPLLKVMRKNVIPKTKFGKSQLVKRLVIVITKLRRVSFPNNLVHINKKYYIEFQIHIKKTSFT